MATRFIIILFSISVIQIINCSTYCDFKKIFQTPVDASRFDNYEILERANFEDDTKKSESSFDPNLPKAFANAQVLVHVQNDKSKCKESCHTHPEPCIRPSFYQFPFPCPSTYPYPYPFPTFNPYIPVNPYPIYPPFNPFGSFQYPQWTVPPSIESKLVLDKPLVVLDEDPKTAVQIDDVFEIPCDTVIKTCEYDDKKHMSKEVDCNKEEEMIEKILNCGFTDEDDCEGIDAKPLDDCDCPKKCDICPEIPTEIEHDYQHRKIIIDDYPPAKISIPGCLPKEYETDERPHEVNDCRYCNKNSDKKYCLYCEKIAKKPCVLEIPIKGDKPYLKVKPSNENCCAYCKEDGMVNSYCSHCKNMIPDIPKLVEKINYEMPQHSKTHCNIKVLPSCTILVDPTAGPPSSDCDLIDVNLIDLEKLPTQDLSDILEREKLRKCQEGIQKCYRCQNCEKVRPPANIKHYKEESDDEKLPGNLAEDDDFDRQVFIYDPNMNTDGGDNVKELTLDGIDKAIHLVDELANLKDLTVDNTEDNIDDLITKTDYILPEKDMDRFLENLNKNIRKVKEAEKYYFLDGRKVGQGICACNSCCCSSSGTKKPFKYDINDLNEQAISKCNQMDALLPKSTPVFDQLCKDQIMELKYEYPNPMAKLEVPRYRVIPTIPSLNNKTPCFHCGHTPCLCNIHQIKDYSHKCCSCRYPCSCQSQVCPVRSYSSNLKDNFRCDQRRVVPKASTNINRSCSNCAPYVGELVTLSTY